MQRLPSNINLFDVEIADGSVVKTSKDSCVVVREEKSYDSCFLNVSYRVQDSSRWNRPEPGTLQTVSNELVALGIESETRDSFTMLNSMKIDKSLRVPEQYKPFSTKNSDILTRTCQLIAFKSFW